MNDSVVARHSRLLFGIALVLLVASLILEQALADLCHSGLPLGKLVLALPLAGLLACVASVFNPKSSGWAIAARLAAMAGLLYLLAAGSLLETGLGLFRCADGL